MVHTKLKNSVLSVLLKQNDDDFSIIVISTQTIKGDLLTYYYSCTMTVSNAATLSKRLIPSSVIMDVL